MTRLQSVDIVRGIVMVLMAIDHVRVYAGVPAGGPAAGVFFTRWVTHFCAPVFVFLAGTAAFLHGRKLGDPAALSRYLVTRGVLLVVLEMTVIRLMWTFMPASMGVFLLAGVIWMLGWCMVLMAGIVRLPMWAIATFGLFAIFAQDVFGPLTGALPPSMAWLGQLVYTGGEIALGGTSLSVLYSIVPWIGVMAAGYAFGGIVVLEPGRRRRLCLRIGLSATALFLVLAGAASLSSEDGQALLFRVLNQRKYPASQLFLLMTLGPAIALLPLVENARGWLARMFITFGRVPMFYYLLHIPVIHLLALLAWRVRDGEVHPEWFATAPYVSVPQAAQWSLPLLYLVFAMSIAVLYPVCRWYARVKAERPQAWMRFL